MDKSIIFDLDGTLWDSSSQVVAAWNTVLRKLPDIDYYITAEDMKGFMGKTADVIAKLFFTNVSDERGMEIINLCFDEEVNQIRKNGATLYPNLEDTLKLLSNSYNLAIVSNCQLNYLRTFLDYYNLKNYFCDYECAGRTNLIKEENIKLITRRNNLKNVVYVGDTQGDYEAAKSANVKFVHAAYGFGQISGSNYYVINSITELPEVVSTLF